MRVFFWIKFNKKIYKLLKTESVLVATIIDGRVRAVMHQRRILLTSILSVICFIAVALLRDRFLTVNLSVNFWSASIKTGFLTLAAQTISVVFDTTVLAAISLAVSIILFVLHFKRYALLLLGAMIGDALLVSLFKFLIMSPRPLNEIINETGYSFPSGHTTGSLVFFGVLTYIAWKKWTSTKVKALTSGLYVSVTAIVSFDRIYLNVHWTSDIVGAVFLGVFWLTLCILIFKFWTCTD
jgi:membrane-associated phospholipid phosphatase